jgi:CRP-like cAMP-binding protein
MAKRRALPASTGKSLRSTQATVGNRLLAALPLADYMRLAPKLEIVLPKLKQFVHRPGEPIEYVYFPGGGFFSELTVLANGDMVEVATIGREGMTGVAAVLNLGPAPAATMVQADMEICHRLTAADFRHEMDQHGAFAALITRYSQALLGVIMQSTACNAVHSLEQRLARWLLMAHDRVAKEEFLLTQEFVAMMLGAARPTVSIVAGALQKAKLIKYHRGQVKIVNRDGLEAASCECYAAATALLDGVTPARFSPSGVRASPVDRSRPL